jgi:hypothetical protein
MRRLMTYCTAATMLMGATCFAPPRAQAMTMAAPAGLNAAIHEANVTQDVAYICRGGWFWRRCGWTPGSYWGYYRPYAYGAYAYYRPYAYSAYAYSGNPYGAYAYSANPYAAYAYRPWWGWPYRRSWW